MIVCVVGGGTVVQQVCPRTAQTADRLVDDAGCRIQEALALSNWQVVDEVGSENVRAIEVGKSAFVAPGPDVGGAGGGSSAEAAARRGAHRVGGFVVDGL